MSDQGQDPKGLILENPSHKIIKIDTETGISELPDDLIVQILSLLPLKDAYKTSILSKRWQYLWTFIDNVIFECLELKDFISFTDNVLCHLNCPNIKKFGLSLDFNEFPNSNNVLWNSKVDKCCKVDKWVETAVHKNVKDLQLDLLFRDRCYYLPQLICNSSSILKLKCTNCELPQDCVLNWTSLKSLTLEDMFLGDEKLERMISSCPQLESLKLIDFSAFHRLRLTSPKCKRLELIDPAEDWLDSYMDGGPFEIFAPYVQHLKISGLFDGVEIKLGHLSSLVCADLTFQNYESLRRLDEEIDKTIVINDLLVSLRCATELTIPSWLTEVISMLMWEKKDASLPLLECKRLTINSWITKFSFLGITSLLRSAPYLENIRILAESDYDGVQFIKEFIKYWDDEDIDLWRNKCHSLLPNLFKGSLLNLKNAKVISKFCRPIHKGGTEFLFPFLKYLLEHAINLKKLVITPVHRCNNCPTKMSEMIEKLLVVPRACNSAIFCLGSVSDVDFLED